MDYKNVVPTLYTKIGKVQQEIKNLDKKKEELLKSKKQLEEENEDLLELVQNFENLEKIFETEKSKAMALEKENSSIFDANAALKKQNEEKKAWLIERLSKLSC